MADRLNERHIISELWEWLVGHGDATTTLYDVHINKTLYRFHEIDQVQLDKERQALADRSG